MASTTATGYMAFNPKYKKAQAAAAMAASIAATGTVASGKALPLIPANKLAAIAERQQDKQRRDAVTSDEDNDTVIGRAVAHTPVDYEDGDTNGEYASPPPQSSSQASKTDAQKKLEEMLKNLTPEQKKALQLKKMANKAKQLQRQQPVAKPEPASSTAVVDAVSDTLQAPSAEFVAAANTISDTPPIAVSTNYDTMYVQMPAVVVTTAAQQDVVVDVSLPPNTSVPVPMLATVSTLDHVDAHVAAAEAPLPRSDLEAPVVPSPLLVPVNVVDPVAQKEVVVEDPPKTTVDIPKGEPKKKEEKTKEKKDKGKQKEKGKSKEKTKDKSKTKGKEKSKDKTKSKGKEKEKGKDKEKHTSKSKGKEKKAKANGKAFMDDAASEDDYLGLSKEQARRKGLVCSSSGSGVSEEEKDEEEEEASSEDSANDIIDDGEIEVVSEDEVLDKAERKIQRAARKLDNAIHSKLSTQTREEKYDNMMKSIIQKHVVKPAPTPVPTAAVVAPVQEVVAPKPDLVEKKPAWLRCLDDDYDDARVVPTQVVAPATEAPATAERPQADCDNASEGVSTDHMVTLMRGVIHSTQLLLNVTSMLFDQKYGKRKRDHASSDAVAAFIVEGGRNGGILSDLADELLQQPQSKKPRVL